MDEDKVNLDKMAEMTEENVLEALRDKQDDETWLKMLELRNQLTWALEIEGTYRFMYLADVLDKNQAKSVLATTINMIRKRMDAIEGKEPDHDRETGSVH